MVSDEQRNTILIVLSKPYVYNMYAGIYDFSEEMRFLNNLMNGCGHTRNCVSAIYKT